MTEQMPLPKQQLAKQALAAPASKLKKKMWGSNPNLVVTKFMPFKIRSKENHQIVHL